MRRLVRQAILRTVSSPSVVLVAALMLLATVQLAAAEKRLALVIGNSAYERIPKLANTLADARLIIGKLEAVGFQVDPVMDATKATLNRAVRDFARKIEQEGPETVALIYYAGHGVQDSRQANYLLAVDSDARSQIDLPIEAIPLDNILKTIEQANPRITIAIVDACRDDPLPQSASRGGMRGLAAPDVRRGLLIAYSTEPGKSAADGPPGRNSPFATALADAIDEPGLEAAQLFQRVSQRVYEETGGKQFPWVTQRLTEPFHFRAPGAANATGATASRPPQSAAINTQPSQLDLGEIAFGRAVIANSISAYEDWLRRYPDHPHSAIVRKLLQRMNEEELWKRIEASTNPAEQKALLETLMLAYPDGVYSNRARQKLGSIIVATEKPPTFPAPQPSPQPDLVDRSIPARPSFDCRRASTAVERLICASSELAALDRELAASFAAALSRTSAKAAIQREENNWVTQRDGCAGVGSQQAIVNCIAGAYQGRLRELGGGGETISASPSFNCSRTENRVEKLICADSDLAAADRRLAATFANALSRTRSAAALRRDQANWLTLRNNCSSLSDRRRASDCIARAYADRISELQATAGYR